MKRFLLILTTLFALGIRVSAQVSIGSTPVPNPSSILDLHSSASFLQLPVSTVVPSSTSLDTVGAMIYYNGNIYLRTATGVKVFTPWKLDNAAVISSSSGNPVGIATIPASNSNRLQVASATGTGVSINASATASIAVGTSSTTHLLMDSDEMMAKNSASTAGTLNLQREDGVVAIRLSATSTNSTVLTANGSVNATNKGKIREHGYDLVPVGSIAMWNSNAIPAGWALCNGGSYPSVLDPAVFITTPDLRGKFIVGAGGDNPSVVGTSYSIAGSGGTDLSSHTHTIDPPNVITGSGTSHLHTGTTDGGDSYGVCYTGCTEDYAASGHTHTFTTNSEASHSHNLNIPILPASGGASVVENRPPFYALMYIMKL